MRALVIKQRFTVFMAISYPNFCFSVCSYILVMCQRSNVLEEKKLPSQNIKYENRNI